MTDLVEFLVFWVKNHPYPVAVAAFGLVLLTWALNRKSKVDQEADRVVKSLIEGSRDKYKDVRPLH
jgi:hypothetical protein